MITRTHKVGTFLLIPMYLLGQQKHINEKTIVIFIINNLLTFLIRNIYKRNLQNEKDTTIV